MVARNNDFMFFLFIVYMSYFPTLIHIKEILPLIILVWFEFELSKANKFLNIW